MVEFFKFIVGDWSGDGHNISDTIIMKAENFGENLETRLKENEEKLKNEFNINLSTWLNDYKENYISKKDTNKLKELKIKFPEDCIEDGKLTFYAADLFADIWIQLMTLVDNDIKLSIIDLNCYVSNCTGYGIYEE